MKVAGIGSKIYLKGRNWEVTAVVVDQITLKTIYQKDKGLKEMKLSFHDFESLLGKKKLVVLDTKRE